MKRAFSIADVLRQRSRPIPSVGPFQRLFGQPPAAGVWFIWGQSGNGKSSFVMQLCRQLLQPGNGLQILYDSLEESTSETFRQSLIRHQMQSVRGLQILQPEYVGDLVQRLQRKYSPQVIVIDSVQHMMISFCDYIRLKEAFPQKLFIFISQADGKNPSGKAAKAIMYDATLKIWVEGYRAFSKGRYFGPDPLHSDYTIWDERARLYWGNDFDHTPPSTL